MDTNIELVTKIVEWLKQNNYSIDRMWMREPRSVVMVSKNEIDSLYEIIELSFNEITGILETEDNWKASTFEQAVRGFNSRAA